MIRMKTIIASCIAVMSTGCPSENQVLAALAAPFLMLGALVVLLLLAVNRLPSRSEARRRK